MCVTKVMTKLILTNLFQWIMDALIANGVGIYIGMMTLKYFSMKTYYWRGLWSIPTYRYFEITKHVTILVKNSFYFRGKLKRMIAQFGPYDWIQFEWRPLSSLGRWCATLGIVFIVSFFFFHHVIFI